MRQSLYSREEKIAIVRDCIVNKLSDKEMHEKYCLTSPTLLKVWKFRYLKEAETLEKTRKIATFAVPKPVTKDQCEGTQMPKRKTEAELIAELKRTQKELEWEKLKVEALKVSYINSF